MPLFRLLFHRQLLFSDRRLHALLHDLVRPSTSLPVRLECPRPWTRSPLRSRPRLRPVRRLLCSATP